MSNFETPEAQAASFAGMTLDAFADMCDREAEHAAEVEANLDNEGGDRFLTEWDLDVTEDRTAEADYDEWAEREREFVMNRAN